MKTYHYRIYHDADTGAASWLLAKPKTASELERAFAELPRDLSHRLPDIKSEVTSAAVGTEGTAITISVRTSDCESVVTAALATTLQDWQLLGNPIDL